MKKLNLTVVLLILFQFAHAQIVNIDIKAFMEGAFNEIDMKTDLNIAGLIPLSQPYNSAPWNYAGTESVATIPNSNVVDWVLVELRETDGDVSTATQETVIARQAGFILKDGTITSTDGINPIQFSITVNYSLYAVIYHRNHLPIMSADELLYGNGSYSWDFTTEEGQVYENFSTKIIESENFIYSWGNWVSISLLGSQVWGMDNTYGIGSTPCAKMSGYYQQSYVNEDWLISPPLNLDNYENEVLKFYNAVGYVGPALECKISENYDGGGNPYSATWTNEAFTLATGFFEWTESGEIDLSGYVGSSVYVAFRYTSTNLESATWEIDNIEITGTGQIFSELGHKELVTGIWGMITGDGSTNYKIDFVDKSNSWTMQAGSSGYLGGDYNLNGEVSNIDKNDHWNINYGRSSHVIMPWFCDMPFRDTRDGKVYNSVKIGTQCWMAENLNIGIMISGTTDMTDNGVYEKYCYNNIEDNCNEYGALYQWDETMQYTSVQGGQGICPDGWHVPTKDEFNLLFNFLGGGIVAGGKLKETGTNHWDLPNYGATNESGFFAYGMGNRNPDGTFNSIGHSAYYYTSSMVGDLKWVIGFQYFSEDVSQILGPGSYGDGVRCLKD